ncbi:Leucine-rich repeat 2 [Corchorus olitorius]|uniref:Leucine-rich repeat 2 n=1 Tax=Corchorus olitorius TaxID=93759 RepID=A0A1R3GDR7_9ROSI|nr:Leucine-rich repeat 2 [Corchorus olitorius]
MSGTQPLIDFLRLSSSTREDSVEFDSSSSSSDYFAFGSRANEANFSLYKDFVDNVLFHHGGKIKKCLLCCASIYPAPHIYAWISAVVSRNVEELTINSSSFGIKDLFTCKTLVSLKIAGLFVVNLPYYVCFPSLKKLHLDSLIYVDDSSMQRLFAGCHVLEELNLKRVSRDCVLIANISIPSLKRLYLDVPHLERVADHEYKTNINAPYLEYLEISDSASKEYSVNFSASLVQAQIIGNCPLLLEGISNVHILTLSGIAMENWHSSRSTKWPTFYNLFHLELGLSHLDGWGLLSHLLNSSPNLETLVFRQASFQNMTDDDEGLLNLWNSAWAMVFIAFVGFHLIMYMLEHAQVLQEMTILWRPDVKLRKKISSLCLRFSAKYFPSHAVLKIVKSSSYEVTNNLCYLLEEHKKKPLMFSENFMMVFMASDGFNLIMYPSVYSPACKLSN